MQLDHDHLTTLATVLRCGSFEGAAAELGLTQPAVSLRIRNLEERVGLPLVKRGTPCEATDAGKKLARHAEDVALLEGEALAALSLTAHGAMRHVRLAINADSLATWFVPVLAADLGLLIDLQVDDQDHSADWLARGDVHAAITATAKPVRGCDVLPLGALRYVATASPDFMARWFPDGVTAHALSVAPMLLFSPKDQLQARWIKQKTGQKLFPPYHMVPSTHGFVDAAVQGAAWGINPLPLVDAHLRTGRLVPLDPELSLETPLFLQISRRMRPTLRRFERAILDAARKLSANRV